MFHANKTKRIFSSFMTFVFVISLFSLYESITANASFVPNSKIYSEGVYMVNLNTDIEVYKKNETEAIYPASTTKIMTCLLTLENVSDLKQHVKISSTAMDEFWGDDPNKHNPSTAALEIGQENITYQDCLYALMLASACEAANILAINVAGDIPSFVNMMNRKAKELGCVNTHFGNAHGLHQKDNFTCAYDMYVITRYAYENYPLFMEIADTYSYDFPPNKNNPSGYTKISTNKLMMNSSGNSYYYKYAKGVKTGSLPYFIDVDTGEKTEGISCLVSTATKDGFTYMLVTLGAPYHDLETGTQTRPYSFDDHVALYKWAFGSLSYQQVLSKNEVISSVGVNQGKYADNVQLKPTIDYNTLLPNDIDKTAIQRVTSLFEQEITAPVKKGEILGRVELKIEEQTFAVIDLAAAFDIERSQTAYVIQKVKNIINQFWFKIGVLVIIILIVSIVILRALNNSKKSKIKTNKTGRKF